MISTAQRIDYEKVAPEAYEALERVSGYVQSTALPKNLLELVRIRASQINGCTYCIKSHARRAKALGESDERIWLLEVWERVPIYSAQEKAALAWTEAVTLISEDHAPDKVFEEVRKYFSEKDIVDLTMAIIAINSWNRLSISMRDLLPA
ncbi:MAG TPA: carboxymuconolactone decarboxylase family protein [Nitrososphaerales archaeon]|nr:carboxymuconolactone decarboxylase family protein [Nitrososphaerales archaeon]